MSLSSICGSKPETDPDPAGADGEQEVTLIPDQSAFICLFVVETNILIRSLDLDAGPGLTGSGGPPVTSRGWTGTVSVC